MPTHLNVLIVEDQPGSSLRLLDELRRAGFEPQPHSVQTVEAYLSCLDPPPDLILVNYPLIAFDGMEALRLCQPRHLLSPLIVVGGHVGEEAAAACIKLGADDFVLNDRLDTFGEAVRAAIQRRHSRPVDSGDPHSIEAQLREERAMADSLRETAILLTSTLELDTVMSRILESVGRVVPHDAANIMLIASDTARVQYWSGWSPEQAAAFRYFDFPLTTATLRQMISARVPIFIADTSTDPDWSNPYGILSFAAAPIVVQDQVIGFLNLDSRQRGFFNADYAERLQAFAAQAGIAIQNAQLYTEIRRYAHDLEDRITARMLELTIANEQLQELDRLKTKFVADVSHELRTPLSNLNLRLYLLEHDHPTKQPEHLTMLHKQVAQFNDLLESVLTFTRMDEERQNGEALAPADLNEIAAEVVTAHSARAQLAGLSLTSDFAADLPPVQAKAGLLARAVTNLIVNAIIYTPAGRITVRTYRDLPKNQVCLEVSDTGMGIAPQDLPHLFERFYRGSHIGSSNIPGTGLGLAIVKEIVDLHKGVIEVTSQPASGTTFRLRLPAA